jgi:hypothetical protein
MADTNAAVERAADALNQAMVSGDRAELARWTAEELVYGHANVRNENKLEFIEGVAKSSFSEIRFSDRMVTVIDNVAIVTQCITRTRPGGKPSSMKEVCTWMLRAGQWKLVARQSVRI